jgi:hypothetical protein
MSATAFNRFSDPLASARLETAKMGALGAAEEMNRYAASAGAASQR